MALEEIIQKVVTAPSVWIEMTKTEHQHGGAGWEFGTCLWSPTRNSANVDAYSLMRSPTASDCVLHFLESTWPNGMHESRLVGFSEVAGKFEERSDAPPEPGPWANRANYYRIPLRDYVWFDSPIPVRLLCETYADEIRAEIIEKMPRQYPFVIYRDEVRTRQGAYISRATKSLLQLFIDALGIEAAVSPSEQVEKNGPNAHEEYAEGQRRRREVSFFARNPKLAETAKARDQYRCQICQFDFEMKYGLVGRHYIECHHLNPLSERPKEAWTEILKTNLNDVVSVCSNCHRMLHRRRPAYTVDEILAAIAANP
jgi:5-methylcytosine-specific restriction endonuclease McrA